MIALQDISGSKGSSKGASSGSGTESSNTLRSTTRVKVLELISEGPCVGLAGPSEGNSIYFDQTPLINENGSVNFRGVQWSVRTGTPDQPSIPGNPQVSTPYTVNTRVKFAQPVLRTIQETNATSARIIVRIPALTKSDANGNISTNSVGYAVQVRPNNGVWGNADVVSLINQKCTSAYERVSVVDLPAGGCPWDIRIVRITADAIKIEDQNETWWDSYDVIVAGRFTYPHSAMVYLDVDASVFDASSLPTRYFLWKGLIISVPSNYDPEARSYSGIWDGTFKQAWTNNPAWIFYDLITNDRYGLGEFVDASKIDKWSLYQIGQYCDQQVPNGYGGTEPRYTFNGAINNRQEAFSLLQQIATAWRGMAYWSLGQVFGTADMPGDAGKLVAPADVIGGTFTYTGTSLKARHSVAVVTWNDPDNFYQPTVELVINNDMLNRYGWRETTVQLPGCTSRSLAHRYGKWILDTEQHETQTVQYQASWDHAGIRPGELVSIADPMVANLRTGGRIASTAGGLELDAPFDATPGQSYTLLVEDPTGQIQSRAITEFDGAFVQLSSPFNPVPNPGAMWVIQGTDVAPQTFRVISVKEEEEHLFTITGLFHDPTKFARVEEGIEFAPPPYTRPKTTIEPPTNFAATETLYSVNGNPGSRINLSWTPGDDFMSKAYHLSANSPNGFQDYGEVTGTSFSIENTTPGDYEFFLYAVGFSGQVSVPVEIKFTALGWQGTDGPYVSNLEIKGRGTSKIFGGRDCTIVWVNNLPQGNPALYKDNIVTVYDENDNLLRIDVVTAPTYTYSFDHNAADNLVFGQPPQRAFTFRVQVRDVMDRISAPASLSVDNPPPDLIIPSVKGGDVSMFIDYQQSTDIDFAGALIWVSTSETFDPLSTTPAYDGPNNFLSIPGQNLTTYWVRMAGYDDFGKTGLNVSPAIEVFIGTQLFDLDPPAVPTGLTLEPEVVTADTGEVTQTLHVTWDKNPSDNFAYNSVEFRRDDNPNWLAFDTSGSSYDFPNLVANKLYHVRVRAFSLAGYGSAYCDEGTLLMPAKTAAPGSPTGLSAVASFKSVFLSWINPTDADLDDVEIWVGTSGDIAQAAQIGTSYTTAFTHAGLVTGTPFTYWVRAVNTSGVASAFSKPYAITPGQVAAGDLAADSIFAENIRAGEITGDHISVRAALPASITVGATGIEMGALTSPAGLINANSVRIEAGKIMIAGDTSLSDWRNGTDLTKIEGGNIAANTVSANSLTIGSRGLTIAGLQFGYDKLNSVLTWTSGTISYTGDDGSVKNVAITAGSFNFGKASLDVVYVAWKKDAAALSTSGSLGDFGDASFVKLASYRGASDLVANYGRTIIDGANILTNSITANQLFVGQLITDAVQIKSGIIENVHLAGNITFDKMGGGTLSAADQIRIGGDNFTLNAAGQQLIVKGPSGPNRVVMGRQDDGSFGLTIYDAGGAVLLSSGSKINFSQIQGFGNLAALNYIPANAATTYIEAAAISDALIANLSASKITAGQITSNIVTTTGQIDAIDTRTGRLRVRMGLHPGVDYGLFVWDYNGNLVFETSGMTGTFIKDLTTPGGKLVNNAVSSLVAVSGNMAPQSDGNYNSIAVGLYLDQPAQVLIDFRVLAFSQGTTGVTNYNGVISVDGNVVFNSRIFQCANATLNLMTGCSAIVSLGAGNHSISTTVSGSTSANQGGVNAGYLTASAFKK